MEHAVGVVGLAHAYGQVPDGKEAAEEALDGTQVRCIAAAALSRPPGSAWHVAAHNYLPSRTAPRRRARAKAGRVGCARETGC